MDSDLPGSVNEFEESSHPFSETTMDSLPDSVNESEESSHPFSETTIDTLPDSVNESEESPHPLNQVLEVATVDKQCTMLERPKTKSKKEYMEECILRNAMFTSTLPSTATDEEKEAERMKVLNDKRTRWRFIFNKWPRDPNGKCLIDDNSLLGKMAGAGRELIWGATLADLYSVYRDPNFTIMQTVISGSKMYNWCKAQGEDYEPAKQLMELAQDEEEPRVVPVYSLENFIREQEFRIISKFKDIVRWYNRGKGITKGGEAWELPKPWPPKSPFHAYPMPWPLLKPFQREWSVAGARWTNPLPTLQEYIPQHLLPEKLVVHDPWNLLCAVDSKIDKPTSWGEKQYIKYRFKLKPSKTNTARRSSDMRVCEEQAEKSKAVREAFLANPHSSQEKPEGVMLHHLSDPSQIQGIGPSKPPVFIVFPLRPAPKPSKKAHLFLSPEETIGRGHHSFVYRAEFEILRSLVVKEDICTTCVCEDVERILLEEDGPTGERRDPKWDQLSGKYSPRERGKPPLTTMVEGQQYELRPDTLHLETVYEGPYRAIQTRIGYQNLERAPYCEHRRKSHIHPMTAKTLVTAKLSIQGDDQLKWEAENYQAFPRDFFEHYSGFNMVKPLTHPTPAGALVPQFYGYYVLNEDDIRNKRAKDKYLSPILLVEDCGKAVVPEELTLDDREECASLAYRLHLAGWNHNSLKWRNIVRQPGPLSMDPDLRLVNATQRGGFGKDWSFRLIDFGRTDQSESYILGKQLLEQCN